MCGRYTLTAPVEALRELFDLAAGAALVPRYNVAPTQQVPIVRRPGASGAVEVAGVRWGFVPSFTKDEALANRMINARGETVAKLPSFRAAFKRRRCLLPADGFYEWQKAGDKKRPWHLGLIGGKPFGIAGIWERHVSSTGVATESCALITTAANSLVAPIHDRMPVILPRDRYSEWLDPERDVGDLERLLVPLDADLMAAREVSTLVNNPRFDDPRCLA